MTMDKVSYKLTLGSIWALVLFSFVSLSASALSHILIFVPAFYGLYISIKNKELHYSKSMIALLCLVIFSVISVIAAPDITNKFKQAFKLKYFIFGMLAVFPYRKLFERIEKKHIKVMLTTFFILLSIGNIAGIHALFDGYHLLRMKAASDQHRAAGMYGMAITYGYGIELIAIILCTIALNYWKKIGELVNKKLFVVTLITCLLGLYFSYSRGAILAFILSVPFIFFKTRKLLFKTSMLLGVLSVLSVAVYVWNMDGDSQGGNRLFLSAKTESNMIRVSQYQTVWKAFEERPFTGFGYRNFEHNVNYLKTKYNIPYPEFMSHAHNNYLEFLAGTGIFGFLSFCAFVLLWIFEVLKRDDQLTVIFIPFLISFSISGLFQNTITDGENMFVIMFFYAMIQAFPKGLPVFSKD